MLDNSNSNAVPTNEPEENLVHLIVRYLQVLLIHKWVFLCGFVLVFTMVLVFAVKQPKLYKSDYEVFYNETVHEYMSEKNVPVVKSDFRQEFLAKQHAEYGDCPAYLAAYGAAAYGRPAERGYQSGYSG